MDAYLCFLISESISVENKSSVLHQDNNISGESSALAPTNSEFFITSCAHNSTLNTDQWLADYVCDILLTEATKEVQISLDDLVSRVKSESEFELHHETWGSREAVFCFDS